MGNATADDYPDEEVFFHDLADGRLQVRLPFLTSGDRTLTLPPVTWVDRPKRDDPMEIGSLRVEPRAEQSPPPTTPPLNLPVCFTLPEHQLNFNGSWLALQPAETVRSPSLWVRVGVRVGVGVGVGIL